ncbi:MAG TPA: DinB family protein [Blastocatellia bacterium]|nr:DinB family protein [Blastocatellia bacterium]
MNLQDIRYLYDYNRWANHLLLDAVAAISVEEQMQDRGVSHQSIHGTLLHLLFAEWVWLERWKGNSPSAPLRVEEFPDLASIRNYWQQIEAEYADFLSNLTEETLQANLTYKDIAGNQHSNPLVLLMQHVVNHATLHRGQVVAMIRQLGIEPPATDFLFFFRR